MARPRNTKSKCRWASPTLFSVSGSREYGVDKNLRRTPQQVRWKVVSCPLWVAKGGTDALTRHPFHPHPCQLFPGSACVVCVFAYFCTAFAPFSLSRLAAFLPSISWEIPAVLFFLSWKSPRSSLFLTLNVLLDEYFTDIILKASSFAFFLDFRVDWELSSISYTDQVIK